MAMAEGTPSAPLVDHPVILDGSDNLQATVQLPYCMTAEDGELNLGHDLTSDQRDQLLTLLREY